MISENRKSPSNCPQNFCDKKEMVLGKIEEQSISSQKILHNSKEQKPKENL
jgi:hypothetical protein